MLELYLECIGMYAERKHWKIEILNENSTELGGYKEISFMVTGKGAYSRLKFESGVHRVQRVPDTESSGRIHTSTATVAVLPVVEDVEIDINPADIKMEVFRASGARRTTYKQNIICSKAYTYSYRNCCGVSNTKISNTK